MNETALKFLFLLVLAALLYSGRELRLESAKTDAQAQIYSHMPQPPPLEKSLTEEQVSGGYEIESVPSASVSAGEPVTTPISPAPIFLMATLNKDQYIFSKNNTNRWPMASITKLMTAVIARELISPSESIEVSISAQASEGIAGGFTAGELFIRDDLIKALILVSSNDAAVALAEKSGMENFVLAMNTKAKTLGMNETFFIEPTGLSALNQASAEDLRILARYIYDEHPDIFSYSRLREITITESKTGRKRLLFNINEFAGRADFIGGKTGFTEEAGGNLLSIFSINSEPIIIVILNSKDRFGDTLRLLAQYN